MKVVQHALIMTGYMVSSIVLMLCLVALFLAVSYPLAECLMVFVVTMVVFSGVKCLMNSLKSMQVKLKEEPTNEL
jgi:hypothetical protein